MKTNLYVALGEFRFARWCLPALALLFLTGCLIIPTPHLDSGYARTNLDRRLSQQFIPGQTTREEIILKLGEPDAISRDERHLAYRSEKVVALWVVATIGGNGAGGVIYQNRFYVFEFGPQGILQKITQSSELDGVEDFVEPVLNPPASHFAGSNSVPAMFLGEPVRHGYSQSIWLDRVDGYRNSSTGLILGEPGCLLLTESNLVFETASSFANTGPVLTVPYVSMSDVHLDKLLLGQRLVIRLNDGVVHSFVVNKPGSVWLDRPAMRSVQEFILSKRNPSPSQP